MDSTFEYYLSVNRNFNEIINKTSDFDTKSLQAHSHAFLEDLDKWMNLLETRSENKMFKVAFLEYHHGLIAVAQGQYRQAFNSLRFFLEHCLAGVYFSVNELKLKLWMIGKEDVFWNKVIDKESGIFSNDFITCFGEGFLEASDGYRILAQEVYRECSEFTHGNYRTQIYLPSSLEFNEELFLEWHDKAESIRVVITFCLCARYLNEVSSIGLYKLEAMISQYLGNLKYIQNYFLSDRGEG
ncbi:hypothetical protein QWJ34_08170 [Saccharibacillus sp. CPCC 101409]|uniref:hypothetical protein n=1 Tax=Saccharibacillus sp. CPCC 101409 TaxID=3058041 RepID=UPI0026725AE8|nr:hypothetical protein [Saccharibacillus sp. CPCC 101409]MDO3409736.1 hypothetical protein [Saccharibacillus sp. CPCC 101409]